MIHRSCAQNVERLVGIYEVVSAAWTEKDGKTGAVQRGVQYKIVSLVDREVFMKGNTPFASAEEAEKIAAERTLAFFHPEHWAEWDVWPKDPPCPCCGTPAPIREDQCPECGSPMPEAVLNGVVLSRGRL